MRCDERQPFCVNCEAAQLSCYYPPPKPNKNKGKPRQRRTETQQALPLRDETLERSRPVAASSNISTTHANAVPTRDDVATSSHSTPMTGTSTPSDSLQSSLHHPPHTVPAVFTAQHLMLLHHAGTVDKFLGTHRSAVDIAVRRAVEAPYLIDQVLAFTALHMSVMYPGSARHLRQLATELQTRGLASFSRATEQVSHDDMDSVVPMFLFSGILGMHVLADTLAFYRADFHVFIDHLVECFNLKRGIRAVTRPYWQYLVDSEIQEFLSITHEASQKITSPGTECDALRRLMHNSDLSVSSSQACHQAIDELQWSFDICKSLEKENYPHAASAFSVKVEVGYVDILRKRQPEALVILAYYGVLLHHCRGFWAVGDAGEYVVRAVASHLGTYWQHALQWPLQMIETDQDLGPR